VARIIGPTRPWKGENAIKRFFIRYTNNVSFLCKKKIMQNLLNITLQDDNSLLVTSDVFTLSVTDENAILALARRFMRADDYKSIHPILKDNLIQWRPAVAKEKNLSAFLIMTNSTLFAISDRAPMTEEALQAIPGFGVSRFAKYGEDILAIVEESLLKEKSTI
jgi:superfamily II DNA helicase RecQ